MGTSSLCHVDSGGITWQRDLPRAGTGCGEGPQDTLEAGEFVVNRNTVSQLTKSAVLLHLQAKDGSMYSVRSQVMLRSLPRHLRTQGTVMFADEIFSILKPA